MKVMIVDDHAGMRALIRELIGAAATDLRECASGEEAVELCKSYVPDCVTLDLQMGAMHGFTAAKLIRQAHPHVNIAVVTHFEDEALRARARDVGADAYFCKDNLSALQRHVETLTVNAR